MPRKIQLMKKIILPGPREDLAAIVAKSSQFYTVITWNIEKKALKKLSKFCLMPVTD